jgi:uncharacterized protein (TIGR03083 family)
MAIDHVELTEVCTAAFTAAVSTAGALERPVPSCPGWTVADAVAHLGAVQAWWTLVLRCGGDMPATAEATALRTPGPDLLDWWRTRSTDFLATLRATPPDTPAWCWWNADRLDRAAAVAWRQAQEAVVHLWDVRNAVGAPTTIDADVAADGVLEFGTRMLPAKGWDGPAGALRLHAVDVDRTWTFAQDGDVPRLVDDPGRPAAATISGTAQQLDLLLWRRVELRGLDVAGDPALATAFLAWPSLG